MREIRTSGSVRGGGGNVPTYSAVLDDVGLQPLGAERAAQRRLGLIELAVRLQQSALLVEQRCALLVRLHAGGPGGDRPLRLARTFLRDAEIEARGMQIGLELQRLLEGEHRRGMSADADISRTDVEPGGERLRLVAAARGRPVEIQGDDLGWAEGGLGAGDGVEQGDEGTVRSERRGVPRLVV